MLNETTLDKIQGAKTVKDMMLWAGLTQREIMALEDALKGSIESLEADRGSQYMRSRDTATEIARVRGGITDAGIFIWRYGYPDQRDYRPAVNHWQPACTELEAS